MDRWTTGLYSGVMLMALVLATLIGCTDVSLAGSLAMSGLVGLLLAMLVGLS